MNKFREDQINNTIGRRYGNSVILEFTGKYKVIHNSHRSSIYLLKCDCGNIFEKAVAHLKNDSHCGCLTKIRRSHKRGSYLPYGKASFNTLYHEYESRAKYKNRSFELTKDEFKELTSKNCYYCGVKPEQKECRSGTEEKDGIYMYNGLDRLNSTLGYTIDNCVPCCEICNKAKRDLNVTTFKSWINRLVSYNIQHNIF